MAFWISCSGPGFLVQYSTAIYWGRIENGFISLLLCFIALYVCIPELRICAKNYVSSSEEEDVKQNTIKNGKCWIIEFFFKYKKGLTFDNKYLFLSKNDILWIIAVRRKKDHFGNTTVSMCEYYYFYHFAYIPQVWNT